ncbi:hypothetical protein A0H76_434 [Hepatospora eriocheir]|uniref:Uncharacterized protein n=1 Tax=Hepatospora eriocheir TaxID=1081669 RepID=A0A1X0QL68_9MICR|nr:hypothetical protein A0H76_434 [Hepatospora eriocheir]
MYWVPLSDRIDFTVFNSIKCFSITSATVEAFKFQITLILANLLPLSKKVSIQNLENFLFDMKFAASYGPKISVQKFCNIVLTPIHPSILPYL